MFSVPLICSSSGVATVSATVSGLAPGNNAVTTTDGGTTSGYSEIGSCAIEIRPARKMATEMTPAKIGRSMKNLDRYIFDCSACAVDFRKSIVRRLGIALRCNDGSRSQPLQVVEDHAVARLDARDNHATAIHLRAELNSAIFGLVAVGHNEDETLALVVADGAFRNQECIVKRTVTNIPGINVPSSFLKRARARIVPEPLSILLSKLSTLPRWTCPPSPLTTSSTG